MPMPTPPAIEFVITVTPIEKNNVFVNGAEIGETRFQLDSGHYIIWIETQFQKRPYGYQWTILEKDYNYEDIFPIPGFPRFFATAQAMLLEIHAWLDENNQMFGPKTPEIERGYRSHFSHCFVWFEEIMRKQKYIEF